MILNEQQIQDMKEGGKITAAILRELKAAAKPGVTTGALDQVARDLIKQHGATPSFLGYNDYPAVLCTSINEQAVHAIPSDRVLKEGDLLKLDFGVIYKNLHTDSAITVLVSDKNPISKALDKEYSAKKKLMNATREALEAGIKQARVGHTLDRIGLAVEKVAQDHGYSVVKELGGHGIGFKLHESPWVANFSGHAEGETKLVSGMAIAIEPILAMGKWQIKDGPDGQAYVMKDGSLAAHFEHTIIITEKGPIVVTG